MCHWIVANLTSPMSNYQFSINLTPEELEEYLPPSLPPKTGPHRYVFVLLEGVNSGKLMAPNMRPHWGYGK